MLVEQSRPPKRQQAPPPIASSAFKDGGLLAQLWVSSWEKRQRSRGRERRQDSQGQVGVQCESGVAGSPKRLPNCHPETLELAR